MRVYISGKITGTTDYLQRFAKAEKDLKLQGLEVINPAKMCEALPKSLEHWQYMSVCFPALALCDTIYMLGTDWVESKGAVMEYKFAQSHKMTVMYETLNKGEVE